MTLPKLCKYKNNENPTESQFGTVQITQSFECNICERKFTTKNNLILHLNTHNLSDNELDEKNESQNTCNICLKRFTAKKNLLKHLRDVHKNYSEAERMVVKKIKCPERNCEFLCRMMKELRNHIEKTHKIKILTDTLQFPNETAFQKWKKEEESNTVSWFVTGRKKTTLTDGSKKQTLYCHRTGHYSPKGFGKYRMRSVGSCKIGVTCPAAMEVTESSEGELTVIYYKTHLGHMQDVVYLKLTREERGHLAEKIQQGFSFDAILEDVKESRGINNETKKRIHLLSKKDLYSIMYRSAYNNKKKNKQTALNKCEESIVTAENSPAGGLNIGRIENKICENVNFCPSQSSDVSPLQRSEFMDDNLTVLSQQKEQLNTGQTSAEGVSSQIVILSPDIDYSSVAEIILVSAGEAATSQTEIRTEPKPETFLNQDVTFNTETETAVTDQELFECKTKAKKSNIYLQLKDKVNKILDYLPQSQHLTPKQFDLINTKLDGVLNIFNIANEKAKTRKNNSRKKETRQNKTFTSILNTSGENRGNIRENQSQQIYESPFIYAVYN